MIPRRNNPGFTLAELLVGIAFFSMVSLVLTGAFIAAFRSQRQAFAFLHMQNNVRFALEVMGREMRTGAQFSLPSPNRIRFVNDRGETVEYCFGMGAIRKEIGGGTCSAASGAITAGDVNVENLGFVLTGAASGDNLQPRITIVVRIARGELAADVQVTVTQRELDT
jgi:Tfp pilus assembly protein PilW